MNDLNIRHSTRSRKPTGRLVLAARAWSAAGVCIVGVCGCGAADDDAARSNDLSQMLLAGEASLWPDTATPAVAGASDSAAVELGVKFRSDVDGTVNAIRFYKASTNTGTHIGHLWSSSGSLLGSVTFGGETGSGWQTGRFSSPIAIRANTTYIASYHTDTGHYAANNGYFASAGRDAPPLHALRDGVDGGNGVYHYGSSGFPNNAYQSSNYWVDLAFSATSGPSGTGLSAQYFDNSDFTALKLTRTDPTVNFNWGSGSPDPSIGADTFSVRWTGKVMPQFSETYTFTTNSDDGVRLWVNGQQLVNNWTDHAPTQNSGTIALTAGTQYNIQVDYFENGGGAVMQLSWSSPSQPQQIVPQNRLFPASSRGDFSADTFLPWHGGPSYFSKWSRGPAADPSLLLTSVWMQTPSNATRYKNVGINFFTGLWSGPTDSQLSTLATAGMPTICDQAGVWSTHLTDTTIRGWLQQDEPDNAQQQPDGSYGPCVDPNTIISRYNTMKSNDPSRPVYLGLGRGVADTQWVGRGSCTGRTDMYPNYAKGADILGYDIYPVNQGLPIEIVATGVDNLRGWSNYAKPVIAVLEASNYDNTARPSPSQIKAEVWMSLVHGAAGLEYFCHRFQPTFSETDCLDDAPTASAMTSINSQVKSLAPVLNTQSVGNGVTVTSSDSTIPIHTMLKRYQGATYVFATEMRGGSTTGRFTLRDFPASASAEVLGENRTISVSNGVFSDSFASYGVHIYRITF